MSRTITIDFETRSELDVRDVGIHKFSQHPSTEVLVMSYALDDGPVKTWLPGENAFPKRLIEGRTIHAHNANFEHGVLNNVLGIDVPIEQVRCSAAAAAQAGLARSLEKCAYQLGLTNQKDADGHKVMEKLARPDKKTGKYNDDPKLFEILYRYCDQDVRTEQELESKLPKVMPFMQEAWEAHHYMNARGIPVDRDLAVAACKLLDESISHASARVSAVTNGRIKTGNQVAKITEFVNERGVNIDTLSADVLEAVLPSVEDEDARLVLELRQSVAGAAAKKFPTIIDYLMDDDRVRDSYIFPGTHTGRAASWGIQVMNLKKAGPLYKYTDEKLADAIKAADFGLLRSLYPDVAPVTLLGIATRLAFAAPAGKVFVMRDLSQIEVRLAHWFCLNDKLMKAFATGMDLYIDFANAMYDRTDITKADPERQKAKPVVLGCNYGMGKNRLVGYAAQMGISLSSEEAEKAVQLFREVKYPLIPKLWNSLDKVAVECTLDGRRRRCGRIAAGIEGDFFYLELPSTRRLYYYKPRVVKGKFNKMVLEYECHKGYRETTWGGTMLENLCQSATADLTNAAIIRAEKAGLCPVINQHDEIGCLVDEANVEEASKEFGELIKQGADWATGLPIKSDLDIKKRWTKQ